MQWLLLLSFCLCIIMIYSFKISPKWYNFVFSRQNYTENRWRCIGRIWLGILKKYFAWKLCIMKVCYGPNISSVWKSSMWTILHGFLADWLLKGKKNDVIFFWFVFTAPFLASTRFVIILVSQFIHSIILYNYIIEQGSLMWAQYPNRANDPYC